MKLNYKRLADAATRPTLHLQYVFMQDTVENGEMIIVWQDK